MTDYYHRWFEVEIGKAITPFILATNDRAFRVIFRAIQDWNGFNSYLDLSIFNLSRETESKIYKRGESIKLKAGYESKQDYVFQGEVNFISREKYGPDRVTRIFAKGGRTSLASSFVNITLGEGAQLTAVIEKCAQALGFSSVVYGDDINVTFGHGYTNFGDPKVILISLAHTHKFNWIVEGEKMVVVGADSSRPGSLHKISSLTGMEGSPEITENGAKVKMRMNPRLKIGQLFQIKSEYPQANFSNVYFQNIPKTIGEGKYKALRIEHTGDSYGNEWSTRAEGIKWQA